jgi:hypothetical protein
MVTIYFLITFALLFGITLTPLWGPIKSSLIKVSENVYVSLALVFIFSMGLSLYLSYTIRMPQPNVNDEFGYLLTADTFLHGRLTNPPHAFPLSFETFHVLMRPTYQSKYPTAQAIAIAFGYLMTHEWAAGVWISTALACAAVTWMLRTWINPRWALAAGLLTALHPMLTKWSQCYWGGSVAMLGGAIMFGAMPRILSSGKKRYAVLFAFGMAILANSRPYEGLVASLFALGILLYFLNRDKIAPNIIGSTALCVFLVLAANFTWMGIYNYKVTGSPLTLPFSVYERNHDTVPTFVFQKLKTIPGYLNQPEKDMDLKHSRVFYDAQQTPSDFIDVAQWKLNAMLDVCFRIANLHGYSVDRFVHVPLVGQIIGFLPAMALFGLPRAIGKSRWVKVAALGVVVGFLSLVIETWLLPHYVAPEACLIVVVLAAGLAEINLWALIGFAAITLENLIITPLVVMYHTSPNPSGPATLAGLFTTVIVLRMHQSNPISLPKFDLRPVIINATISVFAAAFCYNVYELAAPTWAQWAPQRLQVISQLDKDGSQNLVLVKYSADHNPGEEWVHNMANIDGEQIIWARYLDTATNTALVASYRNRKVWVLEPDNTPYHLTPFPAQSIPPINTAINSLN